MCKQQQQQQQQIQCQCSLVGKLNTHPIKFIMLYYGKGGNGHLEIQGDVFRCPNIFNPTH